MTPDRGWSLQHRYSIQQIPFNTFNSHNTTYLGGVTLWDARNRNRRMPYDTVLLAHDSDHTRLSKNRARYMHRRILREGSLIKYK